MKTLFVYHNIHTRNIRHYPLGIGLMTSILKNNGHTAELLFIQDEIDEADLVSRIKAIDPGLIAFSTVTLQWPFTQHYAGLIKRHFDLPIICGGVHPTFMPEEVMADPTIDMICIGEGEYALLEVVERLEKNANMQGVANIWYKDEKGGVHRNELRPLIQDLDALPFADRGIMPFQEIIQESKREPVFMSARGCPYNCTYCSNSAMRSLYKGLGKYIRQRSPENVIAEIGWLKDQYDFKSLNFYDETFAYDKEWTRRFCEMYEREFALPFGCFVRVEAASPEKFRMLRKAGLSLIYLGVESGNEDIRRNIMGRKMSNDAILRVCNEAKAEGIQVWTCNMVGVIGETKETIRQTIELNQKIDPHFVNVTIFQPFPGTRMYEECVKHNYITKDHQTNLFDDTVLDLPTITREDLLAGYKDFLAVADEIRLAHEAKGEHIFLVNV